MFRHILFPTDGSELSDRAALETVQLAKSTSARLTAVTVSIPFHVISIDPVVLTDTEEVYRDHCEKRASKYLDVVRTAADSAGVAFEAIHVFHEHPYIAIIDAATRKGCDVVCMASHGRKGVIALVLGSETLKVLTHSQIPVVVWR